MHHTRSTSPTRYVNTTHPGRQVSRVISPQSYSVRSNRANEHYATQHQNRSPNIDSRHPYSMSPQWNSLNSSQNSTEFLPAHLQAREGPSWNEHQFRHHPPTQAFRQSSFAPTQDIGTQSQFAAQHIASTAHLEASNNYSQHPFKGPHNITRSIPKFQQSHDRRYAAAIMTSPPPTMAARGRTGHYHNLQWTASSIRSSSDTHAQTMTGTDSAEDREGAEAEDDNPFRPSKDLQVEDQSERDTTSGNASRSQREEVSKFSFAFKAKPPTSTTAKSPPDLSRRPIERLQRVRPENLQPRPRVQREGDAAWDSMERRSERSSCSETKADPEISQNNTRKPRLERKVMIRQRAKRALSPTLIESSSIYFRKPGNESVVGSGTYGKVFKAIHVYTKSLAALKKIRMDGEKDGFPVTAVREIKLLQSLNHQNVVSLQEVMVEHNDCFMVFEYLSHDLTGLLNHPTFKLEHAHMKHLSQQLFEGLHYLHRRGVLHRDIKAANILVSSDGQLKLADFGLARFYSKRDSPNYTNRVVTIWYRSPELLLGETQYGPAVDIWSAACVMIEIFTRHAIFPGDGGEINQLDKIYDILGTPNKLEWPGLVDMAWFELLRPIEKKPNTFADRYRARLSAGAFELLEMMFLYDPAKRPSASDVLNHPYFTLEDPAPRQVSELKELKGDWHEFESKALRKENERKSQDARRAARNEEHEREKAKRKARNIGEGRDAKRARARSLNQEETSPDKSSMNMCT